jgi:hypothetical protein
LSARARLTESAAADLAEDDGDSTATAVISYPVPGCGPERPVGFLASLMAWGMTVGGSAEARYLRLHELFAAVRTDSEANYCNVVLLAGGASRYVCTAINTLDRVLRLPCPQESLGYLPRIGQQDGSGRDGSDHIFLLLLGSEGNKSGLSLAAGADCNRLQVNIGDETAFPLRPVPESSK